MQFGLAGFLRSAGIALSYANHAQEPRWIQGRRGEDVRNLQRWLNAFGAEPRLAEDGIFGPKTEGAFRTAQPVHGLPHPGALGADVLQALLLRGMGQDRWSHSAGPPRLDLRPRRAPHVARSAPADSVRAGQLMQQQQGLQVGVPPGARSAPTASTAGPGAVSTGPASTADRELAAVQAEAVASARRELAAGVREDPSLGPNRGARVDEYARRSRMRVGGKWCGYFTGFNLSEGARASGLEFSGINGLHSMQKARSFFEYRSYTDNRASTNERLDRLREEHAAQGSTRRWMNLEGSGGQRHAARRHRPHEVFAPSTLPIRAGDVAVFSRGHVGMVEGYDPATGQLTTIEGNVGNRVQRKTYDLNDPAVRAQFEGFGRPARGDFRPR